MSYLQIQLPPPQLPPRHLNPIPPQFTIAISSNLSDMGLTIIREQQLDPDIQQVMTWVTLSNCPSRARLRTCTRGPHVVCVLTFVNSSWLMACYNVCCQSKPTFSSPCVSKVIIPLSLQPTVLSLLHGDPLAGHFSSDKTFQCSVTVCYWPYIRRDIDKHCQTCRSCESRRNPTPRNKAPMKISNSSRTFQCVFADIT